MRLNYIDLIIIAIVLFSGLSGYKKGLIVSLMGLCRYFICLFCVKIFYVPVLKLVYSSEIIKSFFEMICKNIILNGISTSYFAGILIQISCVIGIFVISNILINILLGFSNQIFKFSPLGIVNKLCGFVFGVIKGLLIVFLIIIIIHPILKVMPYDIFVKDMNNSLLIKYFYMYNFLFKYFNDAIRILNQYTKSVVI